MKKRVPKPVIHRLRGKNGSKTITIPAGICKSYGYKAGDRFEISVIDDDTLNIKKIFPP